MAIRGKLTVFLGMAPGVGKTYAMLQSAAVLLDENVDVVSGYVETHGRKDTEALLHGIPVIERHRLFYQGRSFEELDLDAVLQRHPSLVLIDELAHTNVPGSLHEKRWQDVQTLLDAGIDVYTTLNIQHVESRSGDVQGMTGVPVFETVPDLILEKADFIRIIDLSPDELLDRLRDGKVYLPHTIENAQTHFFKRETLSALRELLLRFTAEKVDSDLQKSAAFQTKKTVWNLNERLMVAVSQSPSSKILIRTARRLAFTLGAPWIAVYVNQGSVLDVDDRDRLSRHLDLAKNLGAEVITVTDTDLMSGLKRIAAEKNVTKILTGRSVPSWWNLFIPALSQRFVKELPDLDVYVIKMPAGLGRKRLSWMSRLFSQSSLKDVLCAAFLIVMMTGLSLVLLPYIGYRSIGFLFLLAILLIGTFASVAVIFSATFISALIWDVGFIPPFGTLTIQQPEDIAMCIAFFGTATVIGLFSYRLTLKEILLKQKETQTFLLYQIAKCFSEHHDISTCVTHLNELIYPSLSAKLAVIPAWSRDPFHYEEKEQAVLDWVFKHHKSAGWATDTLPLAQNWYLPLLTQDDCVGVLSITPLNRQKFLPEEKGVLIAISQQIASFLKKIDLEKTALEARHLEDSKKLYDLIFDCISHELKTPLTSILGNVNVAKQAHQTDGQSPLDEIEKSANRLKKMIDNLLEITKLTTDSVALHQEWIDFNELIQLVIEGLSHEGTMQNLTVIQEDGFPLIWGDTILLERLFSNLIGNVLQHCPPQTPVRIDAKRVSDVVCITVSDQGPGIPDNFHYKVFQKFFRLPGSIPGGTGLGLAICSRIAELHHGTIDLGHNLPKGTTITVCLPHHETP